MPFYTAGRAEGGFDVGIQNARRAPAGESAIPVPHRARSRRASRPARRTASAISSSPRGFRSSCGAAFPTMNCSTSPQHGKLKDPAVLEQQVKRMLADPRSESMVTNFAAQWLFLRDVEPSSPTNCCSRISTRLCAAASHARPSCSSTAFCARIAACWIC